MPNENALLGLLLIKPEVTYGTDPVPTGANVIPCVGDSITYSVQSTPVTRRPATKKLDRLAGWNAMPNATIKFKCELRGNYGKSGGDIRKGASTYAVELDPIFQAANLIPTYSLETVATNDGYVIYSPISQTTAGPSVTVYFYTATKLHKITGGKADLSFNFTAGQPPTVDVTIRGKYVAVSDTGYGGITPTYQVELAPPLLQGMTLTYGSNLTTPASNDADLVIQSAAFALGNQISMRKSILAADGVAGFLINDASPTGSIDPETETEANHPFWADWAAGTVNLLQFTGGSQAGNKVMVTLQVQQRGIDYSARDGVRTHNLTFDVLSSTLAAAEGAPVAIKIF